LDSKLRAFRVALVSFVVLVGCRKANEPAFAPPPNERALPLASASTSRAATDGADGKPHFGSTNRSADGAPPEEPAASEARIRAGSSTRGVIACGGSSCTPGKQACARMSEWQCVPADAVPDADVYFCDDGTDCPAGETCCQNWASAVASYSCSKRRGADTQCRREVCAEGGARCPKGQTCREGTCASPTRAATCGDAGRCPPTRPLCLWSGKVGRCATW